MPELTRSEAQALARYVARFTEAFRREVAVPLATQLRNCQPAEVGDVLAQLARWSARSRFAANESPFTTRIDPCSSAS
jgi:hypothetical protein